MKTETRQTSLKKALNKEIQAVPPVWMMRQAGRYLPEYKKISEKCKGFKTMCYNSDIAAEITLQPIKRFKELDAAIVFWDIMMIAEGLGCSLDFIKDIGPVLEFDPNKKLNDPESIQENIESLENTIKKVRSQLPEEKSLIGFAGGPWTVLSYMLEGKGKRNYHNALSFCYEKRREAGEILKKITDATTILLIKQLEAGADTIQIFESNAGILPEPMFKKFVIEPTKSIISAIRSYNKDAGIICFPRGCGQLYKLYSNEVQADAISIDQFVNIEWAKSNINCTLQGNIDPYLVAFNKEKIKNEVNAIKYKMKNNPFIFNLGHGVIKNTPIENVERLLQSVKSDSNL